MGATDLLIRDVPEDIVAAIDAERVVEQLRRSDLRAQNVGGLQVGMPPAEPVQRTQAGGRLVDRVARRSAFVRAAALADATPSLVDSGRVEPNAGEPRTLHGRARVRDPAGTPICAPRLAYDAPVEAVGSLVGTACCLLFGLAIVGLAIWAIVYFVRKQSRPPAPYPPAGQPPYPYPPQPPGPPTAPPPPPAPPQGPPHPPQ